MKKSSVTTSTYKILWFYSQRLLGDTPRATLCRCSMYSTCRGGAETHPAPQILTFWTDKLTHWIARCILRLSRLQKFPPKYPFPRLTAFFTCSPTRFGFTGWQGKWQMHILYPGKQIIVTSWHSKSTECMSPTPHTLIQSVLHFHRMVSLKIPRYCHKKTLPLISQTHLL